MLALVLCKLRQRPPDLVHYTGKGRKIPLYEHKLRLKGNLRCGANFETVPTRHFEAVRDPEHQQNSRTRQKENVVSYN